MKYAFKDIAFNSTEKRIPAEEDRLSYIGLEHLDSRKLAVTRFGSDVPLKGEKLVMKKGDILFGKRNTYLKRVAIAPHDGLFSAHGMVLRPNEQVISKEFFPFFLSSDYFLDEAIRISVGSLSPTVNWKDLRDLEFEVPCFDEQHKLAQFLSAANDLKESYERMIAATDEMVKSQFIEMFGNPLTNSQNRQLKPFIEVVTLHRGYDLPDSKRNQSGIIPIYGANGLVGYHDVSMAKDGVVTGRSGAIGEVYAVEGDYWPLNTALFSIDTHGNNVIYLQYLLKYFDIKRFGTGTGVPTLNRNDVHKEQIYDVPVPDQLKFTSLVKQADKSKFELKQAIEKIDSVMRALMQ